LPQDKNSILIKPLSLNGMRKLIAIVFLSAHLFGLGGYQLLFNQLDNKVDKAFVAAIDDQAYNENDLIEIKVPIELPYMQNWDTYERYDGEVIVDGVHYNYVKRKLVNDSMSFLCLPNVEKNRLYNARETFFALVNDIDKQDSKKESPLTPVKIVKQLSFDCTEPDACFDIAFGKLISPLNPSQYFARELSPFLLGIERPPASVV
jgi:hypothetical protein